MLIKNTLHQIELCIIITSMYEYWFSEFRIIMFFICKNQNWNKIMQKFIYILFQTIFI